MHQKGIRHTITKNMRRYLYYIPLQIASIPRLFCLLLLIQLTPTASLQAAEIRLPFLGGDPTTAILSPEQETLLGESFMRSLRKQITIINDPEIRHYIEDLGQRLALQSDSATHSFEFFVVDDPSINAFAGPAGKIGIHSGLIEKAKSEGELAAVLAHEIAHVTQRHLMRALESRQNLSLQTAATVLATIVAASANPQAGQAVAATATGLSLQREINFTRGNEQEADRVGMQILHGAGYAPAHMPAFFKRLQQANRFSGESIPEYLRTHPLTLSRIADAENRVAQYHAPNNHESEDFYRIQQQLKLTHFSHPEAAIRHYQQMLQQSTDSDEQRYLQYGYGLALMQADQPQQALEQLQPLLKQHPDQAMLATATAKAEINSGEAHRGLSRLTEIGQLYPSDQSITLIHADQLMKQGEAAEAVKLLQLRLEQFTHSAPLYQKLATTHTQANHAPESHLAQAQFHFLRGETKAALRQLDYAERAARQHNAHFILFSTIDARRLRYEEKEALEKSEIH